MERLPFVYLSTGVVTRFSDCRDPKPRFREVTKLEASFEAGRPGGLIQMATGSGEVHASLAVARFLRAFRRYRGALARFKSVQPL